MIEDESPYQYKKLSQTEVEIALKEDGINLRPREVKQIAYMSKTALKALYKTVGKVAFFEYFRLMRIYTDFEGHQYIKDLQKQED